MRETVRVGVFEVVIDMTERECAESVGEYVIDAIDAGEPIDEIYHAAVKAANHARRRQERIGT